MTKIVPLIRTWFPWLVHVIQSTMRNFTCAVMVALAGCGNPEFDGEPTSCVPTTGKDAATDGRTDDATSPRPTVTEILQPDEPTFPLTVGELTFYAETDFEIYGGTTLNHQISFCAADELCFPLRPYSPGFFPGRMDMFSFRGLSIPRANARLQIKSTNGGDAWNPACFQLNLDGQPVYCRENVPTIGNDPSETDNLVVTKFELAECESCFQTPLTHGPLIGSVTEQDARIWLRTDATRRVGLRVSTRPDMGDGVMAAWAYPRVEDDYTAVLHATGLTPGARYYFQVEIDARPHGEVGTFVTDTNRAMTHSIAIASCTRFGTTNGFDTLARERPDLLLMIGDNHYANSTNLDIHRDHYRFNRAIGARARAFAMIPTIAIWDDHDFTGNDADGSAPGKETSLQIFKEYWANPSYGNGAEGVYFRHRQGLTEFFMLDTRYFRRGGDILGAEQETWLIDGLRSSDAMFKFVVSSVQWTATSINSSDEWQGTAPAQRDRLFQAFAEEGIEGVVLVSGNVHRSEFRKIKREGAYALPEITSSGMANGPARCRGAAAEDMFPGELQFCAGARNTFVVVELDERASDPTVTFRIVDVLGDELYSATVKRSELR